MLRDQLLATFDWLSKADATSQHDGLAKFFATHAIETIAPGHGCVLTGTAVVRRHLAMMLSALADFTPATARRT